ncbi:MAG: hypothetical protein H6718_32775 [Polyangiaceae bacterium]|nr:hypothetical protein [Myxococcales bacterium]MCB9590233.1 hypothetical protein [Polyangiaceae bacterium]MCB9605112.1 hypothetical protein [Polyangiaceae bacterium]
MASLKDLVGSDEKREAVIEDAQQVLDAEVSDKGGISGMAIKTAYKMVKGIQPGFIRKVVNALLDDFLDQLDPLYQEALEQGKAPGQHLKDNKSRVAEALLGVTDKRAQASDNGAVKKMYEKLRPSAAKHVEDAAPRLAAMLERHAG